MPAWRLRDFHENDLDQAISVWDQSRGPDEPHPVFPVSEVLSAAKSGQPAVVAVVGDQLVGMAVAQQHVERASDKMSFNRRINLFFHRTRPLRSAKWEQAFLEERPRECQAIFG